MSCCCITLHIVQRVTLVTVCLVLGARGQGLTCETPKDCEVGNADAVDYINTRAANYPSVFTIMGLLLVESSRPL